MALLTNIKLFLLALWLGAAVLFSAVVAPAAFSVLRAFAIPNTSEIAGTLVTRTLAAVNLSGFAIGVLLVVMTLISKRAWGRIGFILALTPTILMAVTTGVGHWIVAARMRALRISMMVPVDQVAVDDPRRMAFNDLHGYSVAALSVAMIAALVAFITIASRRRIGGK